MYPYGPRTFLSTPAQLPLLSITYKSTTAYKLSTTMSADPYAYLKWPRLIAFNLNVALSITATGLAVRCESALRGSDWVMLTRRQPSSSPITTRQSS